MDERKEDDGNPFSPFTAEIRKGGEDAFAPNSPKISSRGPSVVELKEGL
jgi:hypothetical protein